TVPLLLMVATGAGLPRRAAAGVIAVQCAVYGLYVSWVAGTGQLGAWFEQTLGGIVRATGVATETGFNAVGTPSFLDRVVANLSRFGPSYLLIGVAVGYVAVLLALEIRARGPVGRHAGPDREAVRRLVIYWLAGVVAAVVYTFLLGEVEEQTFYLMAVPATVVIAMLVTHTAVHRALRVFVPVALAVVLAGSGAVWWTIHTRPDDAYLRLVEFLGPQAGTGTVIALGEHTAQFVLPGFGLVELPVSGEPTPTLPPAQYALVSTELSALGLAPVPSTTVDALDRRHPLVFTASGRTVGELRLYDLSRDGRPTVAQGASR
ncbi:MAG: hypothetical protein H7Y15_17890, partial [Pseudonocardia sp.]|nr:hypothetical protein [Pseudonocardia sp.]